MTIEGFVVIALMLMSGFIGWVARGTWGLREISKTLDDAKRIRDEWDAWMEPFR